MKRVTIRTIDGNRYEFDLAEFDINEFSSFDGNLYRGIPIAGSYKWFNLRNVVSITEREEE